MAARKLKVFRTPIGFHDAYVAAPSMKAALEAWGADSNLFASGSAEQVEDPDMMREPLANPGKVIRRSRGTLADHVAALSKKAPTREGTDGLAKTEAAGKATVPQPAKRPVAKPKPRPSREPLERAEAALEALESRQAEARAALARRQAALDRERRDLDTVQDRERSKVAKRVEAAQEKFERAMDAWRES